MNDLINLMKLHMSGLNHQVATPYFGIVTSYDPNTHRAKVQVQPQDENVATPMQSGWLPVCTPTLGNGHGIVAPPLINEQVLIIPDGGDAKHGIIMGSIFSQPSAPPKPGGTDPIQNGEIGITHASGSWTSSASANNGDVVVTHGSGSTLTMTSNGDITIVPSSGTLKVTGNVWATGTIIAGEGTGDSVGLQTHRHGTGSAAAGTVAPTAGT